MRLYEDRVNDTISDERFSSMSKSYEDEYTHKYVGLEELTPYALHEMVKAIYIDEPNESSGKRRQNIHISYDFVSFIPIHELMQEGMA